MKANGNAHRSEQSVVELVKESFLQRDVLRGPLTEQALCKRHGISRSAVREALAHLEHQGLIERRRKTGSRLRKLSVKELADLWDVRSALEGLAARLACTNINGEDLRVLRELVEQRALAANRNDDKEVDRLDVEFHERIIAISRNTLLRDISRNLRLFDNVLGVDYPVPSYSAEDERQPDSHERIVEVLERRDAELAEDLLKRHIQRGKRRNIESLIGKIDPFEIKATKASKTKDESPT